MAQEMSNEQGENVDMPQNQETQGEQSSEKSELWFPQLPAKKPNLMPPLALAYIGDAVYEVAVRQYVLSKPNLRPHHMHLQSTKYVSAKAQAQVLVSIEQDLVDDEKNIVRQGRNAKSGTIPKNANVSDYRYATALESLIGYLYFMGRHDRMRALIALGLERIDQKEN